MSPSRHQIHGPKAFDRPACLQGPARPAFRDQLHAPVRFEDIRGAWWFSFQLEAPAVVWGPSGRSWAYLHDFCPRSLQLIMERCRAATYERRGIAAHPFGFYSGASR